MIRVHHQSLWFGHMISEYVGPTSLFIMDFVGVNNLRFMQHLSPFRFFLPKNYFFVVLLVIFNRKLIFLEVEVRKFVTKRHCWLHLKTLINRAFGFLSEGMLLGMCFLERILQVSFLWNAILRKAFLGELNFLRKPICPFFELI